MSPFDPVCGMLVESTHAAGKVECRGETYQSAARPAWSNSSAARNSLRRNAQVAARIRNVTPDSGFCPP